MNISNCIFNNCSITIVVYGNLSNTTITNSIFNNIQGTAIKFEQVKEKNMLRYNEDGCINLEPCNSVPCKPAGIPIKKEEIPMNYNQTAIVATAAPESETSKQRRYLYGRLYDVYLAKVEELEKKFNIRPIYPKTPEELDQLIKDGHFKIKGLDTPKNDRRGYWDAYGALEFRKAPADQDGFEKAKAALKDARKKAEDAVAILPIQDAFEMFKNFEQYPTA